MTAAPLFAPVLPPGRSPARPTQGEGASDGAVLFAVLLAGAQPVQADVARGRRPAGSACAGARSGSGWRLRTAAGGARASNAPRRAANARHRQSGGAGHDARCARHPSGSASVRSPANGEYAARRARGGSDRAGSGCAGPAPTARLVAPDRRTPCQHARAARGAARASVCQHQSTRFAADTLRSSRRPPALPDRALTSRWRTIKSGLSRAWRLRRRRPLRAGRDRAPTSTWLRSSPK